MPKAADIILAAMAAGADFTSHERERALKILSSEIDQELSRLAVTAAEMQQHINRLELENAHLRVVAQQVKCPYGHRQQNGACALGYPGCACMDDLVRLLEIGEQNAR